MFGQACRRWLVTAALVFGAVAAFPRSASAASMDPSLKWHTAETEHFIVYWYDGEELVAKRILDICEPIREKVTKAAGYTPRGKTHLVVTDVTDSANGFAFTIPYNSIRLFVTGPTEASSLENYDDWLTILLTHEFTHICHIGAARGVPAAMRWIFGTVVTPNEIEPRWIVEGFATYQETALSTAGRGRSSFSDMMVRAAILDRNFPTLDTMGGETEQWPGGYLPYIFGVEFLQYLKATYGDEKVIDFTHRMSAEPFPFYPFVPIINHNAKKSFGKSFYRLWKDWQKDLGEQVASQKATLEEKGLTPIEQLTHRGGSTIAPRVSPDSKKIVYASANGKQHASVRTMDIDGKNDKVAIDKFFADSFSWSADGKRVAFSSAKTWKDYYVWNDIYTWDFDDKVLTRMTRGARARTPDYKPDGTEMIFVTNDTSNNDLATLKVDQTVNWLTDNRDFTQYSTPRYRPPEGKQIALSGWFPGGYRDIALSDGKGKITMRVTADRFIDRDPVWTADGKYLLFVSDRSGISNLYAFEPETGRYWQVTNVLTGAFQPSVSPDNAWIVFEGYTSKGYDIFRTKFDPAAWKEIGWTFDPEVYDATCAPPAHKERSELMRSPGEAAFAAMGRGEETPGSCEQTVAPIATIDAHADVDASATETRATEPTPVSVALAPDPLGVQGASVAQGATEQPWRASGAGRPGPARTASEGSGAGGPGGGIWGAEPPRGSGADEPAPPDSSTSSDKITGGGIRPTGRPEKNKNVDFSAYKQKGYHPWKTLAPRYWLPAQVYITESGAYVGAFTGGSDPLFRHNWQAYINYNTAAAYVGGGGRYFYDRFKPTFYAGGDSYVLDYGQSVYEFPQFTQGGNHVPAIHSTGKHYFEQHVAATLGSFWLWRSRYFVSAFYLYDRRTAWTKLSPLTYGPFIPVQGTFAGPQVSISVDRTEAFRYSISPEKGYRFSLSGQALEHAFGSDYRKEIVAADGRYFIPIGVIPYSALGFRAVAGYAQGDDIRPSTFRMGGAIGESVFTFATPNYYSLRGFPYFAFGGERILLGSAEYRFPIWRANRGLGTGPVFLHMIHGSLFADSGQAWSATGAYDSGKWHTGVGGEVRLDTLWYYFFPLTIRMGYAFALNNDPAGYKPGDPYGYILTLGTSF